MRTHNIIRSVFIVNISYAQCASQYFDNHYELGCLLEPIWTLKTHIYYHVFLNFFFYHVSIISDHAVLGTVARLWSRHPLLFMKLDADT